MRCVHVFPVSVQYIVGLPRCSPRDIGGAYRSSTFSPYSGRFFAMPKINGNEIKPGMVLEHDGGLWAAVKANHVKPGKGGAFAQVELKNLRDGRKLNERFRSEDKVEEVRLENKDQQFLYETDGRLVFMDSETYEQIELDPELLGDRRPFLQDGMTATIRYYGDEALAVTLPQKVTALHRAGRGCLDPHRTDGIFRTRLTAPRVAGDRHPPQGAGTPRPPAA